MIKTANGTWKVKGRLRDCDEQLSPESGKTQSPMTMKCGRFLFKMYWSASSRVIITVILDTVNYMFSLVFPLWDGTLKVIEVEWKKKSFYQTFLNAFLFHLLNIEQSTCEVSGTLLAYKQIWSYRSQIDVHGFFFWEEKTKLKYIHISQSFIERLSKLLGTFFIKGAKISVKSLW